MWDLILMSADLRIRNCSRFPRTAHHHKNPWEVKVPEQMLKDEAAALGRVADLMTDEADRLPQESLVGQDLRRYAGRLRRAASVLLAGVVALASSA